MLNTKPFQKMEGCRRTLFETVEKPALQPLPEQPYVFAVWKRLGSTSTITYNSILIIIVSPTNLSKRKWKLGVTTYSWDILQRKACCQSSPLKQKYHHSTLPQHCPVSHRKYLEWTPSKIVDWAKIGPKTAELVQKPEQQGNPVQRYRSCLGMIRLGNNYPSERMEAAAERALLCNAISYRSLKSILERALTKLNSQREATAPSWAWKHQRFILLR